MRVFILKSKDIMCTTENNKEPKMARIDISITPTSNGYELSSRMQGSYFPHGLGQALFMKAVKEALTEEATMMLSRSGYALVKSALDVSNEIKNGQPSEETKDCPEANGQDDN